VPASEAQGTDLFGRRSDKSVSGTGSQSDSSRSGSGAAASAAGADATPPTMLSQLQAAFQKCRSLLPASGRFGGPGANFDTTQFAAYRDCLEAHGIKIPASKTVAGQSSGSAIGGGSGGGLANLRNNPTDMAAAKACAGLLPQPSGSSSAPSTTAG
jgi:hypothetical protein